MEIIYDNYRDTKKNGVIVKYPNPQFKVIDKVRMSGDNVRTLVQYLGSNEELLDLTDYNEYGWKFLVNKFGINNEFVLNYLDDKSVVGKKIEDISKLGKVFFPTISNIDTNRTILDDIKDYGLTISGHNISIESVYIVEETPIFSGDFNINKQDLLLEGLSFKESDKFFVEVLCNDNPYIVFSTNNKFLLKSEVPDDGSTKAVKLEFKVKDLFPEEVYGYFGTVLAGDQKLLMVKVPKMYSTIEFIEGDERKFTAKFTEEDIKFNKIIWFVITSGGIEKISDINLSRLAWEHSHNPHRNIKEYLLSYSEKSKIDNNPEVCIKVWGNTWMDKSSGTILGNVDIENPILYNSILEKYKNNNSWDRNVRYSSGQIVEFEGQNWESLENNNLGNTPPYSSSWIISDSILSSRAEKIYLLCSTPEGGIITPGSFTKPRSGQPTKVRVYITYKDGYILDKSKSSELTLLGSPIVDIVNFRAHKFDNGEIKVPTLIDSSKSPKIEFKKYESTVKVSKLGDDNKEQTLSYSVISNNTPSNNIDSITLGGGNTFRVKVNPNLGNSQLYVDKVTLKYQIKGTSVYEEDVKFISNGRDIEFDGYIDCPATYNYFLNIAKKYYEARLTDYTGFYVSSTKEKIIDKESTVIRLYPVNDDFTSPIYYKLGTSKVQTCTNNQFYNIYYKNNSIIKFELVDNCYVLTITGGDEYGNSLNGDIDIKIWR